MKKNSRPTFYGVIYASVIIVIGILVCIFQITVDPPTTISEYIQIEGISVQQRALIGYYQKQGMKIGLSSTYKEEEQLIYNEETDMQFFSLLTQWMDSFFGVAITPYYYASAQEGAAALERGEIDLLLDDEITTDISNKLRISHPIFNQIISVAYEQADHTALTIYDKEKDFLLNKTVYIDRSLGLEKVFSHLRIGVNCVIYDDFEEIVEAAKEEKAVIIFKRSDYEKIFQTTLEIDQVDLGLYNKIRFHALQRNDELINLMDHFIQLYRDTFNTYQEGILASRQQKLISENLLTDEEKKWIATTKEIEVLIIDGMYPYIYMEDGKYQGMMVEWLKKFSDIINIPVIYKKIDATSIPTQIQPNQLFISYRYYGEKFQEKVEPLYEMYNDIVVISKLKEPYWQTPYGVKIGIIAESAINPYLKEMEPYTYITYKSIGEQLHAFNKGEIQGIITSRAVYYHILHVGGYNVSIRDEQTVLPKLYLLHVPRGSVLKEVLEKVTGKCIDVFSIKSKWQRYFEVLEQKKNVHWIRREVFWGYMIGACIILVGIVGLVLMLRSYYAGKLAGVSKSLVEKSNLLEVLENNLNKVFILVDREAGTIKYLSPAFKEKVDIIVIEELVAVLKGAIVPERVGNLERHQLIALTEAVKRADELGQAEVNMLIEKDEEHKAYGAHIKICHLTEETTLVTLEDVTKQMMYQYKLEGALENAEVAERAKTDFLAQMSHEMRTPVSAIIGLAQLQLQYAKEHQCAPCVQKNETILKVGQHLFALVNDILDMEKIAQGKLEMEEDIWQLKELLQDVVEMMRPKIAEQQQTFDVVLELPDEVYVYIDGRRLKQVMINLLSNAKQFTPTGGHITWRISMEQVDYVFAKIFFEVEDNGIGISRVEQERIFIPFERGAKVKETYAKGTGLGLPISKKIVEEMGGRIAVESKVGVGSIFSGFVKVKYVEKDLGGNIIPKRAMALDGKSRIEQLAYVAASKRTKRILIVDDVALNRMLMEELLSDMPYEIIHCIDGKECVEKMLGSEAGTYHMIFMDIQMPQMDGYEATQCIRTSKHPDALEIPIIAVSANAFQEDVDRAMEIGMNDYLLRPIYKDKLIEIIERF